MSDTVKNELVFQNTSGITLGRITLAGFLTNQSGAPAHSMRILGSFAVAYLIEGSGYLQRGDHTRSNLSAGDLLILPPDMPHRYGPRPGEVWREFYIVFDGPVFDLWQSERLIRESKVVYHLAPVNYWLKRLMEIVAIPGRLTPPAPLRQACLLQDLLSDIFVREKERQINTQDREWLQRAKEIVGSIPIRERPNWLRVSRQMGVSYETFRKRFVLLAGVSPSRFHTQQLIATACELIGRQNMPIRKVAVQVGFANEFHFSRRFKEITGYSPSEFRRKLPG